MYDHLPNTIGSLPPSFLLGSESDVVDVGILDSGKETGHPLLLSGPRSVSHLSKLSGILSPSVSGQPSYLAGPALVMHLSYYLVYHLYQYRVTLRLSQNIFLICFFHLLELMLGYETSPDHFFVTRS